MKKIYLKNFEIILCKGFAELYQLVKEHGGALMTEKDHANYFMGEPIEVYRQDDGVTFEGVFFFRTWMMFKLGDYLYHVDFNENPLFYPKYLKMMIDGNNIVRGAYYLSSFKDPYLWWGMSDEEIKNAMRKFFEDLLKSPESELYSQIETLWCPDICENIKIPRVTEYKEWELCTK